jgi:hypothetical protein
MGMILQLLQQSRQLFTALPDRLQQTGFLKQLQTA